MADEWFHETLHATVQQRLKVARVLYRKKTAHQDLLIFESPRLGRVLVLDGAVQTTEADEFVYHEMLAHLPLFAHGEVKRALIIGGGDGGALREVLKHPVESVTLVDIDREVIDLCREYLPSLSAGAFDDPRTRLVIADGIRYVAESSEGFDLLVVDSTDPGGPALGLFRPEFYASCRERLGTQGILVTQNGAPFLQADELRTTYRRLRPLFRDAGFYVAPVPTYLGGFLAFGWGTQDPGHRARDPATITSRYATAGIETRYYNPEIHAAAFALPNYVRALLAE